MREQIKKEFADSKVKRKTQKVELIKKAHLRLKKTEGKNIVNQTGKKQLIDKRINPNVMTIVQEINRLAEENPAIEKITFNQVYRLAKRKKVKLPKHDIDEKQLISRIREIVANLKKPTLRKIVDELNKVEDFPRWNHGNFWHYLKDHNISAKSLGIISERPGHRAFLKIVIEAAKEIRQETETVQIPLEKLRERIGLKPAAFTNRVKRLDRYLKKKGEKDFEAKLAKLGIFIARGQREKKASREKISREKPIFIPTLSIEEPTVKINEIDGWIEEIEKLKVNEDTNLDKEETVLILRETFKELTHITSSDKTIRIVSQKIHQVIQQKRNEISKLEKRARKRQKQLNRKIDLKHYEGSAADKLLDLIAERKKENKQLITTLLDRIWRKSMNGGSLNGKYFAAISAAKNFLREVQSKTS